MAKSPEDLLKYTIQMRQRGDSYRAILSYLNRHCDDKEIREKVLEGLDKLEDQGHIKPEDPKPKSSKLFYTILGYVLIAAGGAFAVLLWNQGWVSTLPFLIIIAGFLALSGKVDHW